MSGLCRQPPGDLEYLGGHLGDRAVLVVHGVVFRGRRFQPVDQVGGDVEEPLRVSGFSGPDPGVKELQPCSKEDHSDLGAGDRGFA